MAAVDLWFVSGVVGADLPLSAAWHNLSWPSSVACVRLCWCMVEAAWQWPPCESACGSLGPMSANPGLSMGSAGAEEPRALESGAAVDTVSKGTGARVQG